MKSSSEETMKIKKEKFKGIHYDKNKNYSWNDYINLKTLSLFTENEFNDMFYNEKINCKRIWTCQKEIIEILLEENVFSVSDKVIKNLNDTDKIIKILRKINKDEYINVLDFSHIKPEDYSKLRIVEKILYINIYTFVEEFCIPEKWEDLNIKWKKLLESEFLIGWISSMLSFFFTWFYLLYARRYDLLFGTLLASCILEFFWPVELLFQLIFRSYVALNLPKLCYEWSAPNMRKYLVENYEQWIFW